MADSKHHFAFEVAATAAGGFSVAWQQRVLLQFDRSGTSARLAVDAADHFAAVDILRWGAPFALAHLGLILLHAACVERRGAAIAFIAPGGSGKSTLGGACVDAGWTRVADDALLCDGEGRVDARVEPAFRQWCRQRASDLSAGEPIDFEGLARVLQALPPVPECATTRLHGIAMLNLPRAFGDAFICEPMSRTLGFHALVQHGFATAHRRAAWALEARTYGSLARQIPIWDARAPEGVDTMRRALPEWLEMLIEQRGRMPCAAEA